MTEQNDQSKRSSLTTTPEDSRFLLALARQTLAAAVKGDPPPPPRTVADPLGYAIPEHLREKRGVFVTLHLDGALRGCIGHIVGVAPLLEGVVRNTLSAAFKDPRFLPLDAEEFERIRLEISILSPLTPVDSPERIDIAEHGVVLSRGDARAVFLPQVAREQGWDRETMLSHLALKAGLAADGWRQGATFEVFSAECITET